MINKTVTSERTLALVGGAGGIRQVAACSPWPVAVQRKTFLARITGRVVLTHAHSTTLDQSAFFTVQVTPASESLSPPPPSLSSSSSHLTMFT